MAKDLKQRLTMPINNAQRRRIDRKKLSSTDGSITGRLRQLNQIGNERVSSQTAIPFREKSRFKAFVLAHLSTEDGKLYQTSSENEVFNDQAPPAIVFRIPELHACIPAPANLPIAGANSIAESDKFLINLHPVALPVNDSVSLPKVGSQIEIIFEDPVNVRGPRYLGAIKGSSAEKTNFNSNQSVSSREAIEKRYSNASVSSYDRGVTIGTKTLPAPVEEE